MYTNVASLHLNTLRRTQYKLRIFTTCWQAEDVAVEAVLKFGFGVESVDEAVMQWVWRKMRSVSRRLSPLVTPHDFTQSVGEDDRKLYTRNTSAWDVLMYRDTDSVTRLSFSIR